MEPLVDICDYEPIEETVEIMSSSSYCIGFYLAYYLNLFRFLNFEMKKVEIFICNFIPAIVLEVYFRVVSDSGIHLQHQLDVHSM